MQPLLIDTSVWIDFFNGKETTPVQTLTYYLKNDGPLFVCPTIIQEVLQGINSDKHYALVKDYLLNLNVLNNDALQAAIGAAELYRKLRKNGITIRKSNDCLIAYFAYLNGLNVLHQDRDFDLIKEGWP